MDKNKQVRVYEGVLFTPEIKNYDNDNNNDNDINHFSILSAMKEGKNWKIWNLYRYQSLFELVIMNFCWFIALQY